MNVSSNIENLTQSSNQTSNKVVPPQPATAVGQSSGSSSAASEIKSGDTAQVSNAASQVALSPADADVRLDKVAAIQSALKAGTYSVPASAVAQKVIGSLLAPEK